MNSIFIMIFLMIIMSISMTTHPLILISETILLTLFFSWFLTQILTNSWLSLILILIWLGGLLIIFLYLTSMIPNEISMPKAYIFTPLILILPLTPMMMTTSHNFMKKIFFFSTSNYSMMIPLILMYIIMTLSVSIQLTSQMKTPTKQEMN